MSAEIIPFGRMVECVACGRMYRGTIRPTNHRLLQERRANMCPECSSAPGGEIAALEAAIDSFLDPVRSEVAATGDATAYLNFLIELQRLGAPED